MILNCCEDTINESATNEPLSFSLRKQDEEETTWKRLTRIDEFLSSKTISTSTASPKLSSPSQTELEALGKKPSYHKQSWDRKYDFKSTETLPQAAPPVQLATLVYEYPKNRHGPTHNLVEFFKKKQNDWKELTKNLVDSHSHLDFLFAK